MANVLVFAESRNGELRKVALEAVTAGRKLADASGGGEVHALLAGAPGIGGKGTARRELEGAAELVEFPLPAVVTIDEGVARPRYPSLKGIMAAKKKPLESKPAQLGTVRVTIAKMELPPERPAGRILGEGAAAVPELVKLLHTEAKVI